MNDDAQRDLDLLALADGGTDLTPQRKAELEAQIAQSPELAAKYEATRLVAEFVDTLPATEPSPAFAARLEKRLDSIDEARARGWQRWLQWLEPPTFRWAMAGAVAAALAIALSVWPSSDSPKDRVVAQAELLEVAEDLELFTDFDVVEQLDVLDDLDVIAALDAEDQG